MSRPETTETKTTQSFPLFSAVQASLPWPADSSVLVQSYFPCLSLLSVMEPFYHKFLCAYFHKNAHIYKMSIWGETASARSAFLQIWLKICF
jgi:hypothetical protein